MEGVKKSDNNKQRRYKWGNFLNSEFYSEKSLDMSQKLSVTIRSKLVSCYSLNLADHVNCIFFFCSSCSWKRILFHISTQWHKQKIPVPLSALYFISSTLLLPQGTEAHIGKEPESSHTGRSCAVNRSFSEAWVVQETKLKAELSVPGIYCLSFDSTLQLYMFQCLFFPWCLHSEEQVFWGSGVKR